MNLTDLMKAIKESGKKTQAYDTQATVRRIEGSTAWVHIPGGVDETPVRMTVKAKPGDLVQVRVGGGKAWITGNATAPPTDDTVAIHASRSVELVEKVVSRVKVVADAAAKIARNTNQYFWVTEEADEDPGAHITEIPQEEFLADPDNGGGNLLARSNGIAIRKGLTELATFGASIVELAKNTTTANIRMCANRLQIFASDILILISTSGRYDQDDQTTYYNELAIKSENKVDGGAEYAAQIDLWASVASAYSRINYEADYHNFTGEFKLNSEGGISDWSKFLRLYTEAISDAQSAPANTVIRLANSHGVSNVPISNACFLITIGSSSTNKIQFCTAANISTYVLYMVKCSGGSWGSWKSITFS